MRLHVFSCRKKKIPRGSLQYTSISKYLKNNYSTWHQRLQFRAMWPVFFPKERNQFFFFILKKQRGRNRVQKLEMFLQTCLKIEQVTGVKFWICVPLVTFGVTVVFLISGGVVVCSVCVGNSLLLRGCSGCVNFGARP